MSILMRPKKETILLSMSELAEADYKKKSPELEQIYGPCGFKRGGLHIQDGICPARGADKYDH